MPELNQYYQILKLKKTASLKEVKQAYRQQARQWHPDQFVNQPQQQQEAEEKFKQINTAYEALKLYLEEGKLPETKSDLNSQKATPEFYYHLGIETAEKGELEESLTYFTRAIKLNPDYLEALRYRLSVFQELGFNHRARADEKKILEVELNQSKTEAYSAKVNVNSSYWRYQIFFREHSGFVSTIQNYQDQILVSGSYDKTIKIWDLKRFQLMNTLQENSSPVTCLALSTKGRKIASFGQDKILKIWGLKNAKLLQKIGGLFNNIPSLSTIKFVSESLILTGSQEKTIQLWDLKTKQELYKINNLAQPISLLALPANCQTFATTDTPKTLTLRKTKTGNILQSIPVEAEIIAIAYHPNLPMIALGLSDSTVRLINFEIPAEVLQFNAHSYGVSSVLFSSTGDFLVTAGIDRYIKTWNLKIGDCIDAFQPQVKQIPTITLTSDDQYLIFADGDNKIQVWQRK